MLDEIRFANRNVHITIRLNIAIRVYDLRHVIARTSGSATATMFGLLTAMRRRKSVGSAAFRIRDLISRKGITSGGVVCS